MSADSPPFDKRFFDVLEEYRSGDRGISFRSLILAFLPVFRRRAIDYAFTDTLAIRLHGAPPAYHACNVRGWLTREGWGRLMRSPPSELNLHETNTDEVSISGWNHGAMFHLCDSVTDIRETVYGVSVITLPILIADLMQSRSRDNREVAVRLIQANRLGRDFETLLPEGYRSRFRRLLQTARSQTSTADDS